MLIASTKNSCLTAYLSIFDFVSPSQVSASVNFLLFFTYFPPFFEESPHVAHSCVCRCMSEAKDGDSFSAVRGLCHIQYSACFHTLHLLQLCTWLPERETNSYLIHYLVAEVAVEVNRAIPPLFPR